MVMDIFREYISSLDTTTTTTTTHILSTNLPVVVKKSTVPYWHVSKI